MNDTKHDLVATLNELLEAERAGARVTLETARQARHPSIVELMQYIQHDEARWCAMLLRRIRQLGGTASPRMGAFYEKAMAIDDIAERITFLNRGQGWVVRKLRELIPKVEDASLSAELHQMLSSHVANITLANSSDARALSGTAS
ncbi:MAG: ferritin-like domain-containing protein [Reyranella sp.]|nr:ferritin-like domain-containing protein [Reyranella sp.]